MVNSVRSGTEEDKVFLCVTTFGFPFPSTPCNVISKEDPGEMPLLRIFVRHRYRPGDSRFSGIGNTVLAG